MLRKKTASKFLKNSFLYCFYILFSVAAISNNDNYKIYRVNQSLQGSIENNFPLNLKLSHIISLDSKIFGSPVIKDNKIVLGAENGNVYCFKPDGTVLWIYETDNAIESPALIVKNMVYVGNLSGTVYALDLFTGEKHWKYQTDNQIMGSPNYFFVNDDQYYIIFGSYDFFLYCVDGVSGVKIWKYEANDFINVTPAIFNNYAVFGGCDGNLHVVDILSGKKHNKVTIATYVASSVAIIDNKAIVGDYDGKVNCVNIETGEILWQFENPERQLPFISSAAVFNDKAVIGSRDKNIYCIDINTGELIWQRNTGSRIESSPLIGNNAVLTTNMRGDILLISMLTGNVVWKFETGSSIMGSPAISGNEIFIPTTSGDIYVFKGFSLTDFLWFNKVQD